MNQNYNNFPPINPTPKKPWFLQPDIKPPKGYNPYIDEAYASEETDTPTQAVQLPWESPIAFEYRKQSEELLQKRRNSERLKSFLNGAFLPILLTLFMMNAFSSAIVMFEGFVPESIYAVIYNIHLVLTYAALFPVSFFIYSVGKKFKTYTFFKKPEASKFYIARWTVIIFGVTYAVAIAFDVLFMLFGKLGLPINELPAVPHDGVLGTILYFIAIVICAPIFEEILFRGFLLTRLSRFGAWFAIIVSGVTFGLFHQNHEQIFYATAFGILCGFVAMRTRSVIPSLIAHLALNLYGFLTELITSLTGTSINPFSADFFANGNPVAVIALGFLIIACAICMIVGITMLVFEIVKNKGQFSLQNGSVAISNSDKTKTLFSTPIVIILFILLLSNLIVVSFANPDYMASMLEMAESV